MVNVDELIAKDGEDAALKFVFESVTNALAEMIDSRDIGTVKFITVEPCAFDSSLSAEDYYTAPDYAKIKVHDKEWEATSVDVAQKLLRRVILPLTEWFIRTSADVNNKASYNNKIANVILKAPKLKYTQKVQQVTHSMFMPETSYTGKSATGRARATSLF